MADDVDTGFGINSIKVIDNSLATVTAGASPLNLIPSIHPVFSSDGKDNRLFEIKSNTEALDRFGDDFADYKKYGQQNLNALHVLATGGTTYLCRLMPKDAIYSSLVIKVGVKHVDDIPLYKRDAYGAYLRDENNQKIRLTAEQKEVVEVDNGDGTTTPTENIKQVDASVSGVRVKIFAEPVSDELVNKHSNLERLSGSYDRVVEDDDGYTIFPLMFVAYYARGKCGNNYGLYLTNDLARDDRVEDGRRYQLYLVKKTPTGALTLDYGNGISFSFNPDAKVSLYSSTRESLKVNYENNDANQHERPIQIYSYETRYTEMVNKINELLSEGLVTTEGFDPDYEFRIPENGMEFDFVGGVAKDGFTYDTVDFDADSVDISKINYLQNGTDGSFEGISGEDLQNARENLLKSFFNCDIDTPNIMNVLQCDGAIIYDANYSMGVKKAMCNMIEHRRDICTIFDCGETENLTEAVAVAKAITEFAPSNAGENFAIVPHFGTTVDRAVNVRVSATYEMAYGLTRLYRTSPFAVYAGKPKDQGCIRTMKFDWIVEEGKPRGYNEKLAKDNRLYYAIDLGKAVTTLAEGNQTGRNVYFFSNSNLYNYKLSKLSEFRNGLLINDIRRMLKLVLVKYTFDNDGAQNAIEGATEELNRLFSTRYPGNVNISLSLYQTSRDRLTNQATCDIVVTFPDIFETWNCTITAARNSVEEAA